MPFSGLKGGVGLDTERVLAIMRGDERGVAASLSRAGLWALSVLYGLVIGAYWLLYRFGVLRRVCLRPIVISVGNLTVGGTGKTTTIQYLARLLTSHGRSAAILSYGYRAAGKDDVNVVSDGENTLMTAADAGDEAVLLARSLPGVPVLIGRRRVLSGAEAERLFRPDVLLCDDAFQYWRLKRDVDLVLVDAVEPWGYGYVLPRGLLREPKRQARRADAFLVTHADLAPAEQLAALVNELAAMGRPVWTARHEARGISDLEGRTAGGLDALCGQRVLAVSSLGDPSSFEATLRNTGAEVIPCRFADHHRYTVDDIRSVQKRAAADELRLVTTAKDAVKLLGIADCQAWWVLDIALAIDEAGSFDKWVIGKTIEN